jgi:hypothetical protein
MIWPRPRGRVAARPHLGDEGGPGAASSSDGSSSFLRSERAVNKTGPLCGKLRGRSVEKGLFQSTRSQPKPAELLTVSLETVGYQGSALPLSYGSEPAEILDFLTVQTHNIIGCQDFFVRSMIVTVYERQGSPYWLIEFQHLGQHVRRSSGTASMAAARSSNRSGGRRYTIG